MERRTIKMTTFAIFLSILSVATEFAVYYFTDQILVMAALTALASFILSHVFLELSLSYETGLLFSCLSMLLSTGFTALIYFNQTGGLLVYKNLIQLNIYLQWLVPMSYYIFRCLLDRGPRFVSFNSYFYKASVLFAIYYICNLVYHTAIDPIVPAYAFRTASHCFVPFLTTATHIEDFIYTGVGIGELLIYIGKLFLLFAPLGFYAALLLRKQSFFSEALLALFVPVAFEGLSFYFGNAVNIDSILYRFFGILFGILLFKGIDGTFRHFTREEFLFERNRYSFLNNY